MTPPGASPSGDPHRAPQGDIGSAWSAPPGGPRRAAPAPQDTRRARDARVAGGVAFAGTLMLCGGVLAVLQGIPALMANGGGYPRTGSSAYDVDLTAWGWIHVVLGVLAAGAGAGLLRDAAWARYPALFVAALSLVTQFLFLPHRPLWSVTVMAIDAFVICALVARQEPP
ncbi:hypothetical protein [Streptomyces sp. CAI-85]|uniref:DUF7144 family membrane protein n=1 Tax=Streptomyces sp. CAI-85 TaxID=1472662 RepID=UPI00158728AE|nr:hypothetical protein [Streptomyces sp. CAI-85]MBO7936968.1 hypothetical protein [Streptomyces sp. S9]NUV59504.1 hypothetical protein [Streptomyces sp. CAI-85]